MSGHRPTQLQACGALRPIGEVVDDLVADLRFHREAEKLHTLGARPYGELLLEIGEQFGIRTFIEQRLREYAAIPPETLRELDGNEFPRPPLYQVHR